MLSLQINVQIDEVETQQVPQNILNEMDGFTKILGITRYEGEKHQEFVKFAHKISKISYENPDEQQALLNLELRAEQEQVVLEYTSLNSLLCKIDVLNNYVLKITTYSPGSGSGLFVSSVYTYDLLNRSQYPFLEEVLAEATVKVDGLRAFISPLGHGRYNHILPYHLSPVQNNYFFSTSPVLSDKKFYLNDKYIIPDSLEFTPGDMPLEEIQKMKFVNQESLVVNPQDVYVNYWTGLVVTGSDFEKYNSYFSYKAMDLNKRFIASPGSTIFSYASRELATRLNTYDHPNQELQKHRFQNSQAGILEGHVFSNAKISSKLSKVFEEGKLLDINLNRWG